MLLTILASPPIEQILNSYLPILHRERKISDSPFPLPDALTRFIKARIQQRNLIVHGRPTNVDSNDLDDFLGIAKDLLYILDDCRGFRWARDHVSEEICKLIGWPEPPFKARVYDDRPRKWLEK